MIRSLTLSNYRSLGEGVRVAFDRFTVLVGPNGSGKSNVMDALRFLSDAVQLGLGGAVTARHGIHAVRRWSGGGVYSVALRVDLGLEPGSASYGFELTGSSATEYEVASEEAHVAAGGVEASYRVERGVWKEGPSGLRPAIDRRSLALPLVGGDERFQRLARALQNVAVYAIFPDTLRVPQAYSPSRPMSRHGDNWVSILHDQPEASWKPELVAALQKLTGDMRDIRVARAANYLVAQFEHASPSRRPKWFDASQESDGTLRVAGIITALLQQPAVEVLGVEEPELTVHPGAIPLLFDHLQQAAGRGQVIVTTHSPELLDLVDSDAVRVVERDADGVTTVARLDATQRDVIRRRLMTLGEIMRGEGLRQETLPLEAAE